MEYREVDGNIITLAKKAAFDVIAHGCNCFCTMGAGLAPQMAENFGCDEYPLEQATENFYDNNGELYERSTGNCGNINKLGQIDYRIVYLDIRTGRVLGAYAKPRPDWIRDLIVVNCYSQYGFGRNHKEGQVAPLDYEALALCLRKMNKIFSGKHIGLPQIGCHLAGGDWDVVKQMIQDELKDCRVTVVIYDQKPMIHELTETEVRPSSDGNSE